MAVSGSASPRKKAAKPQPIVLVKPPKKIADMTPQELDEFARKIWLGVKKSGET
jgi:hypothetical protein